MVEALKNLCGISWMNPREMYDNYNIRKFQADLAEKMTASKETSVATEEVPEVVDSSEK